MAVTFYYNNTKIQIFKIICDRIDNVIQMHSHAKNGYEIHFISSGRGILETPDKQYKLTRNSLYVTGPNVLHKQIPDKENPMCELCVYLKISSGSKDSTINFFTSRPFWIGKSNTKVSTIFRQMIEEDEKNEQWSKSILSALCIKLIAEMSRLYSPADTVSHSLSSDGDLNESRSWILDQLLLDDCSNVTLNDFAQRMGVCPRQAERIIKDYYGSSFKKLRYESKMAMAATFLEQEDISIEECSVRCGYSSVTAFVTAFKQKYKITPKAYRNSFHKKI